jgi:signal transduction histidine kinase
MTSRRRLGLQGWLIAALIGVGCLASLAVILSVLPTFERTVKRDRASNEANEIVEYVTGRASGDGTLYPVRSYEDLVEDVARNFGAQVRAVRRPDGAVLARSASCCALLERFSPTPDIGREGYRTDPDITVVWVQVPFAMRQTPAGGYYPPYSVQAAVPLRGGSAEFALVRNRLTIAVAVVFGLAALAGYILARVIGRRIQRLARTASTLASGDLAARAHVGGPQELGTLADGLNTMAARIEAQVGQITGERDRARVLISSLAEGVVAVGDDGRIGMVNPSALNLLGLSPGTRLTRLDELPYALVRAVEEAGALDADTVESEVSLPSGRELQVVVARLATPSAGTVVTLRDVTEERRLERARRDLVANVSHELKTPLAAIKGLLELLEGEGVDPRHRAEFLQLMSTEADRLERLVEEQLQLARLDAGGLPLERERFDLDDLAEGVAASRRPLAEVAGIRLSARTAPSPVTVDADAARIEQVLLILIDNALRHTPKGGAIEIVVGRDGADATLAVRDTGEGIPAEEQPFVFDRFYRGDRSREGRSAGLGLAIARGLVSAHGGAIDLVSAPGRGSTFTVRIPLAVPPTMEHPIPAERPPVPSRP